MACLIRTLEAEIIPRLMASYQDEHSSGPGSAPVAMLREQDVHDFTDTVLHAESAACIQLIEAIRGRGVPLQSIYLHLLAPAAQKLGAMWESDACDFTQITIAMWRMQQVMYDFSPAFHANSLPATGENKKIMLAAAPGSQHTMGILMVAEFFRRAGWGVWGEPACSRERLLQEIRSQRFDAVGISVGSETQLPGVASLIEELRRQSKNKSLAVMAGGPIFVLHPGLAQTIGADGIATDAEHAVEKAEALLAMVRSGSLTETRLLRAG